MSLKLLLSSHFSCLITPLLLSFLHILDLLGWHGDLTHMLAINLVLLSNSSFLVSQISLLIRPEGVISDLRVSRTLPFGYAAPGTLPRPYIWHAIILSEAKVFSSHRWLVAHRAIVVKRLSHNAVAEMLYATYTVEYINVTIVNTASKFRKSTLGLLGYYGLGWFLLVLIFDFKWRLF